MYRETSREAYITVDISDKQRIVLQYIVENQPCTNLQIATGLGWAINRVTPRTGELVQKGHVQESGYTIQPSGRKAHMWKVSHLSVGGQANLF